MATPNTLAIRNIDCVRAARILRAAPGAAAQIKVARDRRQANGNRRKFWVAGGPGRFEGGCQKRFVFHTCDVPRDWCGSLRAFKRRGTLFRAQVAVCPGGLHMNGMRESKERPGGPSE
jgi:hypothetical protein